MADLLPCPFCGSTNLRHEFAGSQGFIECNECGTVGPCDERAADPICDIEAAADAWNRRPTALAADGPPAEPLERLAAPVPVAEPPAPPADYIDPEHSGTNREMLEVFYSATLREGGTADEIALRGINAVLARWGQPPAPPAEGEVAELVAWLHGQDGGLGRRAIYARIADLLERHAAPVPVPVNERLPGPEDCDAEGRCWLYRPQTPILNPYWDLVRLDYIDPVPPTHWLPAHALPMAAPQGGEVEP